MTSTTGLTMHGVERIAVKSYERKGTNWMVFTFVDKSGGTVEVTAFVEKPIAIEGADFLNFVASEPTP